MLVTLTAIRWITSPLRHIETKTMHDNTTIKISLFCVSALCGALLTHYPGYHKYLSTAVNRKQNNVDAVTYFMHTERLTDCVVMVYKFWHLTVRTLCLTHPASFTVLNNPLLSTTVWLAVKTQRVLTCLPWWLSENKCYFNNLTWDSQGSFKITHTDLVGINCNF